MNSLLPMKHIRYLCYVLIHKWFVFWACANRGLIWRGLVHDLSKFGRVEWFPYAEFFYGKQAQQRRDKTGYYKPTDTGDDAFERAWLHHAHTNDHHWQYWALATEDGVKTYRMPHACRVEMLCDWIGAGKAQGKPKTWEWYAANKDKMQLHPETREWVEGQLRALARSYGVVPIGMGLYSHPNDETM